MKSSLVVTQCLQGNQRGSMMNSVSHTKSHIYCNIFDVSKGHIHLGYIWIWSILLLHGHLIPHLGVVPRGDQQCDDVIVCMLTILVTSLVCRRKLL